MITILGPTASGKTPLAVALAIALGKECRPAEIISADSRQVYRRMDIGTGKDLADYRVGDTEVAHHLIDICEPGSRYNLFEYQQDFYDVYRSLRQRGVLPIVCGGTGLYIEAVLKGYHLSPVPQNEELRRQLENSTLEELTAMLVALKQRNGSTMHNTTDVDSAQRAIRAIEIETYNAAHPMPLRELPPISSLLIGVDIDRDLRREKISSRLKARLDGGMIDEVKGLLSSGVTPENLTYYGLEYRYVTEYVTGRSSYQEMYTLLETAIHQFAKRQMTWFRGMERRGFHIHWIDATLETPAKVNQILTLFHQNEQLWQ